MRDNGQSDLELTHRELQILELVAQGYSAKEVAQAIKIAPRTVEGHIDTIRLKLRARNRTHMVTRAIAANMLSPDGHPVDKKAGQKAGPLFHSSGTGETDLFNHSLAKFAGPGWRSGAIIP